MHYVKLNYNYLIINHICNKSNTNEFTNIFHNTNEFTNIFHNTNEFTK